MPNLRSGGRTSATEEWLDDLNTTIQQQPAETGEAQPMTMEARLDMMQRQMQDLQAELRQSQQQHELLAAASRPPSNVNVESVNGSLVGVLSDLHRTLADSRATHGRKLYDLPEFDGRPEDWPMFREAFTMTTEEYHYNDRQNMMRLQKAIKGRAREVVECLLIHSGNVSRVLSTLGDRFGRPEQLVKSQIAKIQGVAPIAENRIDQIVPFATKVQNLSSFLQSANCDHHLSNPTLMDELLSKLPVQRRIDWARHALTIVPRPNICHFSDWLQELSKLVPSAMVNTNADSRQSGRGENRTRFFHTQDINSGNRDPSVCVLCKGRHSINRCKRFLHMQVGQRWRVVRQNKLCFNCLKSDHRSGDCTEQHRCDVDRCTRKQHELLHFRQQGSTDGQRQLETATRQQVLTNTIVDKPSSKLLYKILPVRLYANGRVISTFALFDDGSAISMMNSELAGRLGLKGQKENLTLQWFGGTTVTEQSSRVDVEISGVAKYNKRFSLRNVSTVANLQLPAQTLQRSELHYRHRHLPIKEYVGAVPELLVGLDNAHLSISKKTADDGGNGYSVTLTKLGWIVYGGNDRDIGDRRQFVNFVKTDDSAERLERLVSEYLINEDLGVRDAVEVVEAADIAKAKTLLEETTVRKGSHFETGLLWKHADVALPDSRKMAENRKLALEKKFKRDENFKSAYVKVIEEYEAKGYARKLTPEEITAGGKRSWYLPHFGVWNANKPGKMRLVFDAAAKVNGVSLNSALLSGPDLNQPLATILLKFRERPVGVCADIVEMFHQVKIRSQDQAAQRFIWRTDSKQPFVVYGMDVMTFGVTCSPSSAQFVKNKNAEEFREQFPEAANAIINNHYVDDFVHCFSTVDKAIRTTKQVAWIHKQGGFDLKRFVSNSEQLMKQMNNEEKRPACLNLDRDNVGIFQKVLGLHWDTLNDDFRFVLSFAKVDPIVRAGTRRPTKRGLLSVTMSVFDPFGMAAEYTMEANLLLQATWRAGIDWDEPIPDELQEAWLRWLTAIKRLEEVSVPRCYGLGFHQLPVELHVFADASEVAYAAVAYWRFPEGTRTPNPIFISGKAKCAPLKLTSIPRLELQAAVLATRLRKSILQCHGKIPKRVVMWSDSKTVLAWVKSDYWRYKPYVAHRVNEILEASDVNEWRWVPSALNPADWGTRPKADRRSSTWISGHPFLSQDESLWPSNEVTPNTQDELRANFSVLTVNIDNAMFTKFSSLVRLTRVVGWILRFQNNCRKDASEKRSGGLSALEIKSAEIAIISSVQRQSFADEYCALIAEKQVERSSPLRTLTPMLDEEGVIRVGGRIDAAVAIPPHSRRPIILPKRHHVTALVVDYYHKIWKHQNESTIVAEIRRRYWIPQIRTEVRRAMKKCPVCIKEKAKPNPPQMGQLPPDRLTPFVRPFTYVGLDYMGPFTVAIGRRSEKRWIALFTCLTVRAVHLELARDLTTDTCLMCIRNFMNRRGTPVRIRSDNGTNFIGADKELRRQRIDFDNGVISNALANKNIEWVFNCPLNRHAGGCWERLVRSVKRAMGHALNNENIQEHCLYSLMCEAENIVNARPLTHIPLDEHTDEPLTPNHFLLGTPNSEQTPHPQEEKMIPTRKMWYKVQQMQHRFWRKWIDEYLPDLTRRTKWYGVQNPLAVGDVVLLCDTNVHRSKWQMGRITQVFPSKDGQVRAALVQTKDGVYKRAACILARLDLVNLGRSTEAGMLARPSSK
ncbi:PREDICTED: uncharacterized protein LOC108360659 [Rhagoletis zephyria]|uniref:uncharacterized protein LOC108360659 n=1 Tax=Rhagoletis zephyria TaxID=28612 RepID=UPI0008119EFB|nr:PREDICTED: uncharacterized protein LOC108360659 [Rhagoletis zephyria]